MVSEWEEVVSGVLQCSMLGPVLFTIFIIDIDQGVKNTIKKFTDDTKLMGKAGSEEEVNSIRKDLKRLNEWSEVWQIKLNVEKCMVMHLGNHNREETNSIELESIAEERRIWECTWIRTLK